MKLVWLCNMRPSALQKQGEGGGLWLDQVFAGLRKEGLALHILYPGAGGRGELDETCSYASFREGEAHIYMPEQEAFFQRELEEIRPDVIHIWGTEYGHTLAMMKAVQKLELLDRTVISIQGLCSVYAGHYAEGVPYAIQKTASFRDIVRRDNIRQQQEKFRIRGEHEVEALKLARHVIGRTQWDRACTEQIRRDRVYHFCNETLRTPFFEGAWTYAGCKKHRIFSSSCSYPVKGFHYLLEAFREVLKVYPDATLVVPGRSLWDISPLRKQAYHKYLQKLARGIEDRIQFLGGLSGEEMKQAFLQANVFVLPSTIENSPNSLGEAMLLGVPCVAADVGGVKDLMVHEKEGILYQSTAPYMLAQGIERVFAMEERAEELGRAAHAHAARTHDPEKNLKDLLDIYQEVARL